MQLSLLKVNSSQARKSSPKTPHPQTRSRQTLKNMSKENRSVANELSLSKTIHIMYSKTKDLTFRIKTYIFSFRKVRNR